MIGIEIRVSDYLEEPFCYRNETGKLVLFVSIRTTQLEIRKQLYKTIPEEIVQQFVSLWTDDTCDREFEMDSGYLVIKHKTVAA